MNADLHEKLVRLESYKPEDRAAFHALLSDAEVMAHVGGAKNDESIARLFQRALNSSSQQDFIWAIRQKSDDAYVGHAALFRSEVCGENDREILFYLSKHFWGAGFGSQAGLCLMKAARMLGLKTIWATIDCDHPASIRVCESIGLSFCRKGHDESGEFLIYSLQEGL
jgi:RimJ/RimL family protein N-acetyltransferase